MFYLDIFRKLNRTTQDQRAVIFKGNNFPIVIKTNERKKNKTESERNGEGKLILDGQGSDSRGKERNMLHVIQLRIICVALARL